MSAILSREKLYQLIWRSHLRDLAARFGLTEPTIKKRCISANIPVPAATYWTKVAKGHAVVIPPLPARAPGMDEFVSMDRYPEHPLRVRLSDEELMGPVPPPPVFAESLEEIRARYLERIGAPVVARDLSRAHHKIRALLAADDRRRQLQVKRGYFSSYDGPKFDGPFEQRRLRVLNAIMMATLKAGAEIKIADQSARSPTVRVGDTTMWLRLDSAERLANRYGYYPEPPEAGTPLHLRLERGWDQKVPDAQWSDEDGGGQLEGRVGPIVAELIVQGEAAYRRFRTWENEHRREMKRDRVVAIRRAEGERLRAEEEQRERAKAERIDLLLSLAAAHRQAGDIRSLVRAGAEVVASKHVDWAEWALGVAAELDPVTNGRLSSLVEGPDALHE